MVAWREFKETIMGLNADEAFRAACCVERQVYALHNFTFPPERNPVQDIPGLLMNFSAALARGEGATRFDQRKVDAAVNMILGGKLREVEVFAAKLARRIEFQPGAESRPTDIDGVYGLAIDDAREGMDRGFHWGGFLLRRAFERPSASTMGVNNALELFEGLSGVPQLVLDQFGEAGMDVALQMERHLRIVEQLPVYSA